LNTLNTQSLWKKYLTGTSDGDSDSGLSAIIKGGTYDPKIDKSNAFVQATNMIVEMMKQYNKGITTSLTMSYEPLTGNSGRLHFDHDGFVPYNGDGQQYDLSLSWVIPVGGTAKVYKDGDEIQSGANVTKDDDITLEYTGSAPTFTLTDNGKYLKAGSIKGNLIGVSASSPIQKLIIGHAEFVTLKCVLNLNSGVAFTNSFIPQTGGIVINGIKTVTGTDAPDDSIFKFKLTQVTDQGGLTETVNGITAQTQRTGSGTFSFRISELNTGTYYFKIEEIAGGDGGWTYDTAPRIVKVVVASDKAVVIGDNSTFQSRYTAGLPEISQNATYMYTGDKVDNGPFTFADLPGWGFTCYDADHTGPNSSNTPLPYSYSEMPSPQVALMLSMAYSNAGAKLTLDEFNEFFGLDVTEAQRYRIAVVVGQYYSSVDVYGHDGWIYNPSSTWPTEPIDGVGYSQAVNQIKDSLSGYFDTLEDGLSDVVSVLHRLDDVISAYNDGAFETTGTTLSMEFNYTSGATGTITFTYSGYAPPAHDLTLYWIGTATVNGNTSGSVTIPKDATNIVVDGISGDVVFTLSDSMLYVKKGTIEGSVLEAGNSYRTDSGNTWQRLVTGYAEFVTLQSTVNTGNQGGLIIKNAYGPGGSKLPEVGGMGDWLLILTGLTMMAIAAALRLIIWRRTPLFSAVTGGKPFTDIFRNRQQKRKGGRDIRRE